MAKQERRCTPDDPETLAAVVASIKSMTAEEWDEALAVDPTIPHGGMLFRPGADADLWKELRARADARDKRVD